LGAVAGAVFGHAYDSSEEEGLQPNHRSYLSSLEASQLAFFVSTFSMLAKLVKIDGQVSNEEIDAVEFFASQDLKLSVQDKEIAFNVFRAALNSPAEFEDFAVQFYQHFQQKPQMIEMMVDILLRVSVADGDLNTHEERLIKRAVDIFHFGDQNYFQLKSRYVVIKNQAYQILGCTPDDTDEQVKKQYRALVHSYHPDKIASKGLPEEFIQLAHDKFRQIQTAYDEIRQERGIK
jgi:DnaJ like chaperone protein